MSGATAPAPPRDRPPARSIQAMLDEGDACLARRAYADAVQHFAEAARHAPHDPAIRRWLIIALMRAGEIPSVLEQSEALLTLAPNDAESVRLVAYAYLELHRQSRALLEWPGEPERVDTAAAGYPLPFFIPLAPSLLPHAVVLARLAVANDPANAAALRTLAQALGEAGEYHEALTAARGAVRGGDGADACLTLARLSANAGLLADATDAIRDPILVSIAPSLATGRQLAVRYDAPEGGTAAPREVPVHLLRDGRFATRSVQVAHRAARCETIHEAEVVGAHFFPVLADGTAKIHDVVELDALHLSHPLPLDALPAADRACTVLAHDRASRRLWLHVPHDRGRYVERAALLATNAHANYCHWLLGSLPRLLIAGDAADALDAPWIVPHELAAFQDETLNLLGIPHGRRLRLRDDETIRVGELVVPYDPQCAGTPAPALVRGVRQRLLGGDVPARGHRRIYLSRRGVGGKRRLLNEPAVEALFVDRGFEVVETERMTVCEQIALFREAAVVAGPTGAAFANLIFAPPECRAVITIAQGFQSPIFCSVAEMLGQEVLHVLGVERPSALPHPHWHYAVALDDIRRALAWVER